MAKATLPALCPVSASHALTSGASAAVCRRAVVAVAPAASAATGGRAAAPAAAAAAEPFGRAAAPAAGAATSGRAAAAAGRVAAAAANRGRAADPAAAGAGRTGGRGYGHSFRDAFAGLRRWQQDHRRVERNVFSNPNELRRGGGSGSGRTPVRSGFQDPGGARRNRFLPKWLISKQRL